MAFDHILQSSRFFALIMVLVIFSFPLQVTPVVTLILAGREAVLNPGVNGHPEAGPWAPLDVQGKRLELLTGVGQASACLGSCPT